MINRLSDSLDFQAQALQLRAERLRLLASNIANADTPGYVARDMDFAAALRQATAHLPRAAGAPAAGGADVPLALPVALRSVLNAALPGAEAGIGEAHLRYATPSQSNLDGNSVDMDRERASFADNTVKYEATLRFVNAQVRTLMDAMKGHHQG